MQTCYLVLGTPRSGTSAVAGILHRLGILMGEEVEPGRFDWPDPNEWNPAGFYQDVPLENLQNQWFGEGFPVLPGPPTVAQRDLLAALIKKRCARGVDWGSKTSRMPWMLPEFLALCPCPVRAILTRRPLERAAASWAVRAEVSLEEAAALIGRAAAQLERVRHRVDALPVEFDALHDRPQATVETIAAFVGREMPPSIVAFLDNSLRRY